MKFKKFFQNLFKKFFQSLFKILYGNIKFTKNKTYNYRKYIIETITYKNKYHKKKSRKNKSHKKKTHRKRH